MANPESDEDAGYLLALAPLAEDIMHYVRSTLPPGQHFGVIIPVANKQDRSDSRIIAMCSDRAVIAPAAAQWALTVLDSPNPDDQP
jgi:hypothetical protein